MGYNLLQVRQDKISVSGDDNVRDFIDRATRMLAVEYIRYSYDVPETREKRIRDAEAAIISEQNLEMKAQLFRRFLQLDVDSPFEASFLYGTLYLDYDIVNYDKWSHEDGVKEMLYAFAPFAKRNAFIGFIGEDCSCWSYVFDGQGSFEEQPVTINWLGERQLLLTRASMATDEDWDEVARMTGCAPRDVWGVKLSISTVDYDLKGDGE